MRHAIAVCAVLGLCIGATFAQTVPKTKPDFSGSWVRESTSDAAIPAGWGMAPTITQTDRGITIVWMAGESRPVEVKRTYGLTGDTNNPVLGRGGLPTGEFTMTNSSWVGNKLVLTTGLVTEAISIEDGKLVYERTAPTRGGTGAPSTVKIIYKKKSDPRALRLRRD